MQYEFADSCITVMFNILWLVVVAYNGNAPNGFNYIQINSSQVEWRGDKTKRSNLGKLRDKFFLTLLEMKSEKILSHWKAFVFTKKRPRKTLAKSKNLIHILVGVKSMLIDSKKKLIKSIVLFCVYCASRCGWIIPVIHKKYHKRLAFLKLRVTLNIKNWLNKSSKFYGRTRVQTNLNFIKEDFFLYIHKYVNR